jgi:hypothetical protein
MEKKNLEQRQILCQTGRAIRILRKDSESIWYCFSVTFSSISWHKDFENGRDCGRWTVRTSTNVDRVRAFSRQDRRFTTRMIADELRVNERTVHQIVTQNFSASTMCGKMVPKKIWMTIEKRFKTNVSRNVSPALNRTRFSYSGHNRRRKFVFRIRSWNQEAEWGMAHATVFKAEESSHEQIKKMVVVF